MFAEADGYCLPELRSLAKHQGLRRAQELNFVILASLDQPSALFDLRDKSTMWLYFG